MSAARHVEGDSRCGCGCTGTVARVPVYTIDGPRIVRDGVEIGEARSPEEASEIVATVLARLAGWPRSLPPSVAATQVQAQIDGEWMAASALKVEEMDDRDMLGYTGQ